MDLADIQRIRKYIVDKWIINGEEYVDIDEITIVVESNIEVNLIFKSSGGSSDDTVEIPYIDDGLTSSFDSLLNIKTGMDTDTNVWFNLKYESPVINRNQYGYSIDGLVDCFDAIDKGVLDYWANKGAE